MARTELKNSFLLRGRRIVYLVLMVLVVGGLVPTPAASFGFSEKLSRLPKEKKVQSVTLGGIALVSAWGVVNWDYGDRRPHAQSEDWFGQQTKNGGIDKLGHLYDNYVMTHGLAWLYEGWGYDRKRAAFYGALSALGIMGSMEAGDSFSDYGFSHEDFLMNALGSGLGYLLYLRPGWAAKFDFRVHYQPDFDRVDIFTDYENQRYLAVVKLAGFEVVRNRALKHLELHLGYYTRGYSDTTRGRQRILYYGVGLNLARFCAKHAYKKTATFLRYYQPPHTSLAVEHDYNR